jgi:hypothetical protein
LRSPMAGCPPDSVLQPAIGDQIPLSGQTTR